MQQIAVIIYGSPGSGKSTQAGLVAQHLGLVYFDTGKAIEEVIYDSANKDNAIIMEQRKFFETGELCNPAWVFNDVVVKKFMKIKNAGLGVVFSGSPRTLPEAFGEDRKSGLFELLEDGYGKKNIYTFVVNVSADHSRTRNTSRQVCTAFKHQFLASDAHTPTQCPVCGSGLRTRSLDKPEVIGVRLEEYRTRTQPILDELTSRGYTVHTIDGEQPPYKVFEEIQSRIDVL
jgi:adenylate kinase